MTVAPVSPGLPAPADSSAAGTTATPGFAETLQRQQALVGTTVTLGQMVSALTGATESSNQALVQSAGGVATDRTTALDGATIGGSQGEQAVIAAARRYLGVPYLWGGTDPSRGLDCSGFVQRVYADLGISLPRVSVDQSKQGAAVASLAQARPGDLVYWSGSPNHIGIYAGDGKMLVAPKTGDVVKYQDITRTPHAIRRIL